MQNRSDLVIVSAFGRGTRVATELAKKGLAVSLVDVSDQLGRWTPEDWAGPFGYFEEPNQPAGTDVESVECEKGFTIWLNERPIEFRGPLKDFTLDQIGVSPNTLKYLTESRQPSGGIDRNSIQAEGFEKTWLAHFAHQFSANVFLDNFQSLGRGYARPLGNRFFVRTTTRDRIIQSFRDCLSAGAKVFTSARIADISIVNGQLDAVEIYSERSGVLTSSQFVWMLSSEESEVFPDRVKQTLYPKGAIESSWCWVRFSFNLPDSFETRALPAHFVMMKDHHLPWSHSHCSLVQRSLDPNKFDVWIRIPSKRRFQRAFLDEQGSQILTELKNRLPAVNPVLLERPAEYMVSHKELGAPRYQVYTDGHLNNLKRLRLKNLMYCGPEDWMSLDSNGQADSYQLLRNQLVELFNQSKKGKVPLDQPLHPN
jgi:hypothetical protein